MKKISFFLAVVLLALQLSTVGLAATSVGAPNMDVGAEGVYLYNVDYETLIWDRNAHQKFYPASLTKIMTCILALENTANLDQEKVVYPQEVQDTLYRYQLENGSISLGGLLAGEVLTMRQALYALMLPSANEVALSIAYHIGGSPEGFADMMNARARELGALNTNFVNPNGLHDPNHYTTPYDMAMITLHAMELPGFMEIATTLSYESGPTSVGEKEGVSSHENLVWSTTNLMMIEGNSYYHPYVQGIKTGTTPEAGRCFITSATKDGFTYLLVLMNAPFADEEGNMLEGNAAFRDAGNLLDWVFDTYRRKTLVEMGKYVVEVPLNLSMDQDHIKLMTASRFQALVPNSIEASSVTMVFDIPDSIDAPVERNQRVGTATLMLNGEEIGQVDLLSSEYVPASTLLVILNRVQTAFSTRMFKFVLILLVNLIILYIIFMVLRNRRRRRMGSNYRPRRRI